MGWNWATELARLGHRVSVLTRADNRAAIERDSRAQLSNLSFIYYDLPPWMQRWRTSFVGKVLYYMLWQARAVRRVRELFPELPFDAVQHVTYASVRYPSFMESLRIPFYFGPVSGGERVPRQLRADFSAWERWREWLRGLSNLMVQYDPLLRKVFRTAKEIVVTRDTLELIPQRWRYKCRTLLAIGLSRDYLDHAASEVKRSAHGVRLLYVGRLMECKGIDIALHAVRLLKVSHPDVHFTIVGAGPEKSNLQKRARELGLSEIVEWTGWLSQCAVQDRYRTADVFLFPGLRDSGAMVVLEAMAHGLPVVCADLGGPGVIVNQTCGRVVATHDCNRQQLAIGFAAALREIISTPGLWGGLAAGARTRAREFEFQNLVRTVYLDLPPDTLGPER